MTYLVFDLETETHKSHKRTANPFDDRNYVVMRGWKKQGDKQCSWSYHAKDDPKNYLDIPEDVTVLVGHNIKFDLLYEMVAKNPHLKAFFKRGGKVWDTQYAYYLINGQTQKSQMVAMDAIVEEYGGRKKIDGIKELWAAGVKTSEIDPETLTDYLVGTEKEDRNSGDIGNTELIYLGQLKEAEELGMLPAIWSRMDGLCGTTEMEFNGIKVDTVRAKSDLKERTEELKQATEELQQYVEHIPEEVGFSWGSRVKLSCLIFGGTIRYKKQATYLDPKTGEEARLKATEEWPLFDGEPRNPKRSGARLEGPDTGGLWWYQDTNGIVLQDTYLSGRRKGEGKFKKVSVPGELKTKYQDFFYELPGYTKPSPEWKGKNTDGLGGPVYGTGSEVIEKLARRDIPFLKALGRWQALEKEIGTYYVKKDPKTGELSGMLTCVDPKDKIVHHSIRHTNTKTTRLSSDSPNLQNITRGDWDAELGRAKSTVKAMFVSRFENGAMGEIDYSQLEVVVQAWLTNDTNLVRDVNGRVDFHCKRVALKNGISYTDALYWCKDESAPDHKKWKKERTNCKSFSFERAYGAGKHSISENNDIPLEDVEAMIEAEEKEYPGINKFNNSVEAEAKATAEPFRDPERGWRTFRTGSWQAPTGTIYTFRTYDAPEWQRKRGVTDTFMPTEMKNYPIQGTGGEVVQMVLGVLWRWFVKNDNFGNRAFLVNTVHDCVWVDMHPDVVDTVIPGMSKIMEAVPQLLKKKFGIDCPVTFPVEAETGPNMLDLHEYEKAA